MSGRSTTVATFIELSYDTKEKVDLVILCKFSDFWWSVRIMHAVLPIILRNVAVNVNDCVKAITHDTLDTQIPLASYDRHVYSCKWSLVTAGLHVLLSLERVTFASHHAGDLLHGEFTSSIKSQNTARVHSESANLTRRCVVSPKKFIAIQYSLRWDQPRLAVISNRIALLFRSICAH